MGLDIYLKHCYKNHRRLEKLILLYANWCNGYYIIIIYKQASLVTIYLDLASVNFEIHLHFWRAFYRTVLMRVKIGQCM